VLWVLGTRQPPIPFVGSYTLFGNLGLGPGTYDFFLTMPLGGWGNWGGVGTQGATATFYQAPGAGYLNNLFIRSDCFPGDILKGPYASPIGCGTVDFAVPAPTLWNSPVNGYCCAGPGPFEIGNAVLATPEPSAWMLVLRAALLTLVIKWKTLFH
jgi:hypothetical protein